MRAKTCSTLLVALCVAILGLACSSPRADSGGGPIQSAPEIIVPESLVSLIATLTLSVYPQTNEAGVTLMCDPATGLVSGNVSSVTPITVDSSFTKSCGDAGSFCTGDGGSLSVPWSATPWIFSVVGYDSSTQDPAHEVAVGCATANLNKESTASIKITLLHYVPPPAGCVSGTISPPQTCSDGTAVCQSCQTLEELISFGNPSSGSGTSTGSSGQMTNPFFLWGAGSGGSATDQAGAFMAFYSDAASDGSALQVSARFMDDTLSPPASSLFYMVADESSIFLPSSSQVPQPPSNNDEKEPSAALVGSNVYVTLASDQPVGGMNANPFNIFYDSFTLENSLSGNPPCLVSTAQASHINAYPSIAASGGSLYVAWTNEAGTANGALVTPGSGCGTVGTATQLGTGIPTSSGVGPKVAATSAGWVVVWPSSGSVAMQLISASGAPMMTSPTMIAPGLNPVVGSTPSGDFAVAWAGTSAIQMQRYTGTGTPIGGIGSISTTAGSIATPSIAGSGQAGGFYAVSWISGGNSVRARYVYASSGDLSNDSGYLFSPIDGQESHDFQVNVMPSGTPPALANPTLAIGGSSSQYIAFGWENHGSTCSNPSSFPGTPCWGVIARRFQVPVD
jgi:hypothetical protein